MAQRLSTIREARIGSDPSPIRQSLLRERRFCKSQPPVGAEELRSPKGSLGSVVLPDISGKRSRSVFTCRRNRSNVSASPLRRWRQRGFSGDRASELWSDAAAMDMDSIVCGAPSSPSRPRESRVGPSRPSRLSRPSHVSACEKHTDQRSTMEIEEEEIPSFVPSSPSRPREGGVRPSRLSRPSHYSRVPASEKHTCQLPTMEIEEEFSSFVTAVLAEARDGDPFVKMALESMAKSNAIKRQYLTGNTKLDVNKFLRGSRVIS